MDTWLSSGQVYAVFCQLKTAKGEWMQYNFKWDPNKAASNVRKHGVTFEDATKVFNDPMALTVFDDQESGGDEDRWITLGLINGQHYLVV